LTAIFRWTFYWTKSRYIHRNFQIRIFDKFRILSNNDDLYSIQSEAICSCCSTLRDFLIKALPVSVLKALCWDNAPSHTRPIKRDWLFYSFEDCTDANVTSCSQVHSSAKFTFEKYCSETALANWAAVICHAAPRIGK